jgi:hypothetical protein
VRYVVLTLLVGLGIAHGSPKKPSAPVDVRITSRPVAGGYQVRLIAIAMRDVPEIELSLAGKKLSFGATAEGQRRELVTTVAVKSGEGLDVVGSARAGGRSRAEVLHVGQATERKLKQPTIVTLPDGRQISEVR